MEDLKLEEILYNDKYIIIDVRSQGEYEEDHIPGAINLPILSDEERAEVGTVYKNVSQEKAKALGLRYSGPKLEEYYEKVLEFRMNHKEVCFYCFRGGMRSHSIAKVMELLGERVHVLEGGYKTYRSYVIEELGKFSDYSFNVIHGYTGSGKTVLLNRYKGNGRNVIDLEGLAKNRGSVFGDIGIDEKISQKKFDSLLLKELKLNRGAAIFVESESKRIGSVLIPDHVFEKMQEGRHFFLKTKMEDRIKIIRDDYLRDTNEKVLSEIRGKIEKLKKQLGNEKLDELLNKFDEANYDYVIEKLMVDYYDPWYEKSIVNYTFEKYIKFEEEMGLTR